MMVLGAFQMIALIVVGVVSISRLGPKTSFQYLNFNCP